MNLPNWLRRTFAHPTAVRRSPPARRLGVECLEDRTTPSTPGEFDPAFGTDGAVTTDFNGTADYAANLAVQPNDGKIIVVGYTTSETTGYDFAVARYNANGTLDSTFGTDPDRPGRVTIDFDSPEDYGASVTILSNGQILLAGATYNVTAGRYDFAVARLTSYGALDSSFGGDGLVTVGFDGVGASPSRWNFRALPQGDKIIVIGGLDGYQGLVRLNGADGSVDTSFGEDGDGGVFIPVGGWYNQADAVVQSDGKIVVAGERGLVLRLDSDGRPDSTFVQQTLDFSTYGMSLDAQGNVLLAGRNDFNGFKPTDFFVARLKGDDGSLDPTFGTGGEVQIDLGSSHEVAGSLAVQADGKILVFGALWEQNEFEQDSSLYQAVVRLTTDGGLDGSFGSGGSLLQLLPDWFGPPAIHPDGSILSTNAYPQPGTDYDFVLTRRVGLTDADGDGIDDGIDDFVDADPAAVSDTFSDGTTTGSIISRGNQTLAIVNALDPAEGVVITAAEGGGTTPAEVRLAGGTSSFFLSPGDRITLTHGSVIVHVMTGTVEATFVAEGGAVSTTSLAGGNTVTFKPETGVVIAAATNTQPVVVTTNGTVVTVNPGASAPTATPSVTVTGGSFIFDEQAHPATGSVIGVLGENLGTPTFTYSYTDNDGNVVTGTSPPVDPGYYTVTASFAGNGNYNPASATATIMIAYEAHTLTDLSRAFNAGRTIPIKIQLLDANGNNLSSSSIDLTAIRLERVNADGSVTQVSLQDAGNANPGNLFRYDAGLHGYVFNLSTKGLGAGTYNFYWMAEGDPTEHKLSFRLV
jgi:uncharacterized delta-60 repeat protein